MGDPPRRYSRSPLAKFVLHPCHLREDRFAPIKGAVAVTMNWAELVTTLAPSQELDAKMTLRSVSPGSYVGITKDRTDSKKIRNFVILNPDRSAKLDWLLKKDPSFENRLLQVFRVDEVVWESVVQEFDTPGQLPWTR